MTREGTASDLLGSIHLYLGDTVEEVITACTKRDEGVNQLQKQRVELQ
jgi:hypothetical protein